MTSRRSVFLTISSQGLSAATNALVSVLGSIVLIAADFGAVAAALIAYRLVLVINRSTVSNILIIRIPELDQDSVGKYLLGSLVVSATVGLLGLAVVFLVSLLFDPSSALTAALRAVAVGLPPLAIHETLRSQSFALRRPGIAVVGDAAWLISAALLWLWLRQFTALSGPSEVLIAWVSGAVVGAIAMMPALWGTIRHHSVFESASKYFRHERATGSAFAAHSFIDVGTAEIVTGSIGASVGLSRLGQWSTAKVAMSPVDVLRTGAMQWAVPNRSELTGSDRSAQALYSSFRRVSLQLAATVGFFALVFSAIAYYGSRWAPPESAWTSIEQLLIPAAITTCARAAKAPFPQVLQILGDVRRLLQTQIITAVTLIASVIIASRYSIVVIAYVLAVHSIVFVFVWASAARSASESHTD